MSLFHKILIALILSNLVGCASAPPYRPDIWQDQHGIVHHEKVSIERVARVRIASDAQIANGCIKLNTIYLKGTAGKEWSLKLEAAKMGGTHVTKSFVNRLSDVMGVAWDCYDYSSVSRSDHFRLIRAVANEQMRRHFSRVAKEDFMIQTSKLNDGAKSPITGLPVYQYDSYR